MVMKAACVLALAGVFLIVSSRSPVSVETVEAGATDFEAVCGRARQYLLEGRCDEALAAIAVVENEVRDNVEREPCRELSILLIKARAYWHQMDIEGLERFLTQFEKDYADTSAAPWVQRAAWYERTLGHRFAEDLPEAVKAFEMYREIEAQSAGSRSRGDDPEAAAQDFDLHVKMTAEIADLYRYMGSTDLALKHYRLALEYAAARVEAFQALEANPGLLLGNSLSPSKYRDEILPTAIRECEAPHDSVLGILGRDATCEAQQADWLLSIAQGCRSRKAFDAAREHYHKARQTLEAHRDAIRSLPAPDKARYITLEEQVAESMAACQTGPASLAEGRR
jgi:tetratricopeptide (TPR) repeat protein